ncbi:DUF2332 domain-containing protein [Phenylobacterium soli]|nr:DUF2332 family protein [Phenylobacterium soli]
MRDHIDVIKGLRLQAGACRKLGSEFSAALLERAADDWLAGGPTRPLLAPWESAGLKALFDAATALRLLGALHDLALGGEDAALADAYGRLDVDAAWTAALAAMRREPERLARFMEHEPQTNEVRRSICLVGGFLEIARVTGLPLRCFEIAASAGLNLFWDRYRYEFAPGAAWGDPQSSVRLDSAWEGPPPPIGAKVAVVERAACDRRPVDLTDPAERRRLLAYVWPDQTERLARARAAIELALANGVTVEPGDAPDWTAARVAPKAGAVTVLYHSVFWQYMPAQSQAALAAAIAAIAAKATPDAPFAWLAMEPPPENMATMEVRLTLWPGGERRTLAEVHPHGAWVRWRG